MGQTIEIGELAEAECCFHSINYNSTTHGCLNDGHISLYM